MLSRDNKHGLILPNLSESESIIIYDFLLMKQKINNLASRPEVVMECNTILRSIAHEIQRGKIPSEYSFKKFILKRLPQRYWDENIPIGDSMIYSYIMDVINYLIEKSKKPDIVRQKEYEELLSHDRERLPKRA